MDLTQFDKYTKNLQCYGLISCQDITFPNVTIKIPFIGIHEVIAHYINKNLSDKFYLSFVNILNVINIFSLIFEYFGMDAAKNVVQLFLSHSEMVYIPFVIRVSMFLQGVCKFSFKTN